MSTQPTPVVLEPAARAFAEANATPPYLFDLGPAEGRKVVDDVQSGEIAKPDVDIEDTAVPGGPSGQVSVRILRPKDASGALPVIVYIHGAGWVFGNAHTHDRLIRELTAGTGAAVVFPTTACPRKLATRPHSRSATRWRPGSPSTAPAMLSTAHAWR